MAVKLFRPEQIEKPELLVKLTEEGGRILLTLVTPEGDHAGHILEVDRNGLTVFSNIPSNLAKGKLPFPVDRIGRIEQHWIEPAKTVQP